MNHNILHEIEWSTSMMSIDKKMPDSYDWEEHSQPGNDREAC